ncbi:MAG: Pyrrolo-quinoline quinone [Myxococcales bacterium]|nr:Pyrrolo-quinoline quinone [Myxococcales bacterium]
MASNLEILWQFKADDEVVSSAVIGDGRVYVASRGGTLYALDHKTGAKIWSVSVDDGIDASPILIPGSVVVGASDGVVRAYNRETGSVLWTFQTEDKVLASATYHSKTVAGPLLVVGSYDGKLYALEPTTGKLRWSHSTENYVHASASVTAELVVFGGCDGYLHLVSVKDGSEVRKRNLKSQVGVSPAIEGDQAYLGVYGNRFVRMRLSDAKVVWEYRDQNFPYLSPPALGRDAVYFGSRDRHLHAVSRDDGAPLWTFRTRGAVDGAPVLVDDKIVFGSTDGRLYLLRAADGEKLWSYDIGGSISSTPAVVGGVVVIGSSDGSVYAFGTKKTEK